MMLYHTMYDMVCNVPYHTISYHIIYHTLHSHTVPNQILPYPYTIYLSKFQDQYDNVTGTDLNGKIEISINKAPQTNEVPMLQGNVQKTEIPLVNGAATVQTLSIEQNTPGKDGQEYVLSFTVNISGRRHNIPAFTLPFLFYNGKIASYIYCLKYNVLFNTR